MSLYYYSLLFTAPVTHSSTALHNPSTSSTVFPACRHTRTLSCPAGTVGATIGLTVKPLSWQYCAKLLARSVSSGKMGDCGASGLMRKSSGDGPCRSMMRVRRLCMRWMSDWRFWRRDSAWPWARKSYVVRMLAREGKAMAVV